MESKLCITTVVNEGYQEFIPWFVYFINESYPSYHSRIFLTGSVNANVRQCLSLLGGNSTVHEGCLREYPGDVLTLKCLRWMNNPPEFDKFDYIYTGDIDILICREEPGLLEQHVQHCDLLGLPYSNMVRGWGPWQEKPRRFTGLHFVRQKEWYSAMRPVMERYSSMLLHGKSTHANNEAMLHTMVGESGLGLPKGIDEIQDMSYRFFSYHGLHMRLWRMPNPDPKLKHFFPVSKSGWEEFADPDYERHFDQFKKMRGDKAYKQLYKLLKKPREMIDRMIQFYEYMGF